MKRALAVAAAMSLVVLAGQPSRAGRRANAEPAQFPYGVGANDVTATGGNVWTQTTGTTLRVLWSTDPTFASGVHRRTLAVDPAHGGTVLTHLYNLQPATTYYYKFRDRNSGAFSRVGTFQTSPDPSSDVDLTFAYSGDQDGTIDQNTGLPCFNDFPTFGAAQAMSPQFYVNLGDTIYSDSKCLATPNVTLDEYRGNYQQNFSYQTFRDLRAATSFYTAWDDHEVRNNWNSETVDPALLANGRQAFMEYDGIFRWDPNVGFYRTFRWGAEAQIFILDSRSFRTEEADTLDADHDGTPDCQNSVTGQPDLAPTLSQSWRDYFAQKIPNSGLDQPVPAQCTADLNDSARAMLGAGQLARFEADLLASTARFKLVVNQDTIQQLYALPYDTWEGYLFERNAILSFVDTNDINGVVWLTTDIHADLAHTVDYFTENPGTQGGVQGMFEYTVGPVATDTFRAEINATVGDDTASQVRAFLINVNKNTCAMLGGDAAFQGPYDGYGLVHIDAATHTLSIVPYDYTNTKIAGNGVNGAGRDVFCYDYSLTLP